MNSKALDQLEEMSIVLERCYNAISTAQTALSYHVDDMREVAADSLFFVRRDFSGAAVPGDPFGSALAAHARPWRHIQDASPRLDAAAGHDVILHQLSHPFFLRFSAGSPGRICYRAHTSATRLTFFNFRLSSSARS